MVRLLLVPLLGSRHRDPGRDYRRSAEDQAVACQGKDPRGREGASASGGGGGGSQGQEAKEEEAARAQKRREAEARAEKARQLKLELAKPKYLTLDLYDVPETTAQTVAGLVKPEDLAAEMETLQDLEEAEDGTCTYCDGRGAHGECDGAKAGLEGYLQCGCMICAVCGGDGTTEAALKALEPPEHDDDKPCQICWCESRYKLTAGCDHYYCTDCIKGSLEAIMDQGQFPSYCPSCRAEAGGDAKGSPPALARSRRCASPSSSGAGASRRTCSSASCCRPSRIGTRSSSAARPAAATGYSSASRARSSAGRTASTCARSAWASRHAEQRSASCATSRSRDSSPGAPGTKEPMPGDEIRARLARCMPNVLALPDASPDSADIESGGGVTLVKSGEGERENDEVERMIEELREEFSLSTVGTAAVAVEVAAMVGVSADRGAEETIRACHALTFGDGELNRMSGELKEKLGIDGGSVAEVARQAASMLGLPTGAKTENSIRACHDLVFGAEEEDEEEKAAAARAKSKPKPSYPRPPPRRGPRRWGGWATSSSEARCSTWGSKLTKPPLARWAR